MAWFNLLGLAVKTGAQIYENKQKTKKALSEAKLREAELMAKGEIQLRADALKNQISDYKDDFVLIILSLPLILLFYSVFSDDPDIATKLDTFFTKLNELPLWFVGLWASVVAAIYGLRATDIINTKKFGK